MDVRSGSAIGALPEEAKHLTATFQDCGFISWITKAWSRPSATGRQAEFKNPSHPPALESAYVVEDECIAVRKCA
jgi:hypothetical protein